MTHLNDISKVYLEQVSESAVPGKPAERLGAVTAIPKAEQDAARERLLAKAKAKREKMKEETEIEEAVKGADTGMRRAAAAERRGGDRPLSKKAGEAHAANMARKIRFSDKISKAKGHLPGYTYAEAVDQDQDGDNDFADIRIARMIASGVPKEVAIQKTKDKDVIFHQIKFFVLKLIY